MNLTFTPTWLHWVWSGRAWARLVPTVMVVVLLSTALAGPSVPRHSSNRELAPSAADTYRGAPPTPVSLHPADTSPEPPPTEFATAGPLQPHEVFGFAPYWTLPQSGGFDVGSLTTLAYFGVDVNPDGSVAAAGPGRIGLDSQELVNLVNRAHTARDRVVLTAKTFDQGALHQLATDPSAATTLVAALVPLIQSKSLDGANLDFEGNGGADRSGFADFVRRVADGLHAVNPHWQVTVDTYASSANDPGGWFDVPAIAPAIDAFFVMAYDMYDASRATPNSPLGGYGHNVEGALGSYSAAVGGGKVILGLPFYGYNWQTANDTPNAPAHGPPTPMSYSQIKAQVKDVYWDPVGNVPWSAYEDGGWHEVYYDDPTSLGLKARAASGHRVLGVGIWALGMDGNDPAMTEALVGGARLIKPGATGPNQPQPSAPLPTKPPASAPGRAPQPTPGASPRPSPSPSPSPSPPLILPTPIVL